MNSASKSQIKAPVLIQQPTTGNSSLGLVGMRERVRLVHGKITIQSRQGEGTKIEVRVPLTAQTREAGQ